MQRNAVDTCPHIVALAGNVVTPSFAAFSHSPVRSPPPPPYPPLPPLHPIPAPAPLLPPPPPPPPFPPFPVKYAAHRRAPHSTPLHSTPQCRRMQPARYRVLGHWEIVGALRCLLCIAADITNISKHKCSYVRMYVCMHVCMYADTSTKIRQVVNRVIDHRHPPIAPGFENIAHHAEDGCRVTKRPPPESRILNNRWSVHPAYLCAAPGRRNMSQLWSKSQRAGCI